MAFFFFFGENGQFHFSSDVTSTSHSPHTITYSQFWLFESSGANFWRYSYWTEWPISFLLNVSWDAEEEEKLHSEVNMMPISCPCHHHLHRQHFNPSRHIHALFLKSFFFFKKNRMFKIFFTYLTILFHYFYRIIF